MGLCDRITEKCSSCMCVRQWENKKVISDLIKWMDALLHSNEWKKGWLPFNQSGEMQYRRRRDNDVWFQPASAFDLKAASLCIDA